MTPVRSIFPLIALLILLAACSGTTEVETTSAAQRFALGMEEYADENYLEALQHFEVIRLQYPASAVADSARYFTGMCRYQREEYLLATYEFNQLIQGGNSRALGADAYHMFSQCYYEMSPKVQLDQTSTQRAIDALQTFVELYPEHPAAAGTEKQVLELVNKLAEKEYDTGVLYEKMENRTAALLYFSTVVDRYYNTYFVDDGLAGRVRMLMELKRYDEAEADIEEFVSKYADSPWFDDVVSMRDDLQEIRSEAAVRP